MPESPIQRVGGEYDGSSANGWHIMLRHDDGTLESFAGPFPSSADACVELARLLTEAIPATALPIDNAITGWRLPFDHPTDPEAFQVGHVECAPGDLETYPDDERVDWAWDDDERCDRCGGRLREGRIHA